MSTSPALRTIALRFLRRAPRSPSYLLGREPCASLGLSRLASARRPARRDILGAKCEIGPGRLRCPTFGSCRTAVCDTAGPVADDVFCSRSPSLDPTARRRARHGGRCFRVRLRTRRERGAGALRQQWRRATNTHERTPAVRGGTGFIRRRMAHGAECGARMRRRADPTHACGA